MLRRPLAFIKRDLLTETSYRFSFLLDIFGILFSVLTFYFIARLFGEKASPYLARYGGNYFPFVLIGIAFSTYLGIGLDSFSSALRSEQVLGTLEAILVTPTRIPTLLCSVSTWNFLSGTLSVLIYLLLGVFCFGVKLKLEQFLPAFVVLILTITSFSSLGIISAAFIMVFKRGSPINWLFGAASTLLGGVFYPIAILPQPLQKLSIYLPITHSLKGIRGALLGGEGWSALAPHIGALLLFTLILMPIGTLLFKYALKKAKIDGSLVQY